MEVNNRKAPSLCRITHSHHEASPEAMCLDSQLRRQDLPYVRRGAYRTHAERFQLSDPDPENIQ